MPKKAKTSTEEKMAVGKAVMSRDILLTARPSMRMFTEKHIPMLSKS